LRLHNGLPPTAKSGKGGTIERLDLSLLLTHLAQQVLIKGLLPRLDFAEQRQDVTLFALPFTNDKRKSLSSCYRNHVLSTSFRLLFIANDGLLPAPFEFDPAKSASNKHKHGIDFEEAQQLWNDENAIEGQTRYSQEERFYRTGRIGRKFYTGFFTYRQGNIRLISVRRARPDEEAAYQRRRS
jgi:uncharacterized protein